MIEFKKGFYADVRTEDRSRTVISYPDGLLQDMKTSVECRAFLRVYDGKMWYYASVTDLTHLQKTLDGVYPGILTAAMILLCWFLLAKKKMSPIKVMLILVVIAFVGAFVGFFNPGLAY